MTLHWTSDLEIGIPVIDAQHQRIVEYINRVDHAHRTHESAEVLNVLDELVDYTLSHFAFEETLMEEAGYPFAKAHKKVHQLFARRIDNFQQQAKAGEDITEELIHVLKAWLVNHIKRDDNDYSDLVRANLEGATKRVKARKEGWLSRLFG
ncbi:bacteriohemerythrin [Saccharospirillum salsuginis]|uniref:Bacteriohemerythrin n=1 Tax=Saccharospirillum salsuginis TaxID=418750 RepID=A0A918KAT4_9GAMM|nr:bacteriohemerythrin [Saccharospirillum salsuginis]GGX55358.1 bacteriohemerythrin [Saccharospirillum salsuginis]